MLLGLYTRTRVGPLRVGPLHGEQWCCVHDVDEDATDKHEHKAYAAEPSSYVSELVSHLYSRDPEKETRRTGDSP